MQVITNDAFNAAVDAELCEQFELIAGQRAYLEVLSGEEKIVGALIEYEVGEFYNASHLFAKAESEEVYAVFKAIDDGTAKVTFYEYESLDDAKRHGIEVLNASLS